MGILSGFREESEPFEIGIFVWPLLPAVFSCLFVRLIISDFLLSLLVFLRSPPHISFSHQQRLPSLERPSTAADALRFAQEFWLRLGAQVALSLSCLLIGRTQSSPRSDWSEPTPAGGASEVSEVSCARGQVASPPKLLIFAYIHTGNRPKCWH